MELPEPRKTAIRIFGVDAFLQERTAEGRRDIEKAFSSRNGVDSDVLTYALTFKIIESALSCNLKSSLRIHFIKWYHPVRRNALFGWSYLRKHLTESQIIFLIDEINKLDYGDKYEEIKKKMKTTQPKNPVPVQATKQSED